MCSYCGCESIAYIGRFMREHTGLVNASGDLRRACLTGDTATVEAAADALATLLEPHADAEEVGLFYVLRQDEEFTETVDRLCAEHGSLDAMLKRIREGEHAAYSEFELALRGHIDHEDNGLFPAAAIRFAGPEWDLVHELTPAPV